MYARQPGAREGLDSLLDNWLRTARITLGEALPSDTQPALWMSAADAAALVHAGGYRVSNI